MFICSAHSAKFPSAQTEWGRQCNTQNSSQPHPIHEQMGHPVLLKTSARINVIEEFVKLQYCVALINSLWFTRVATSNMIYHSQLASFPVLILSYCPAQAKGGPARLRPSLHLVRDVPRPARLLRRDGLREGGVHRRPQHLRAARLQTPTGRRQLRDTAHEGLGRQGKLRT